MRTDPPEQQSNRDLGEPRQALSEFEAANARLLAQLVGNIEQLKQSLILPDWGPVLRQFDYGMERLEPAVRQLGEWGWTIPSWGTCDSADNLVRDFDQYSIDTFFLTQYGGRWSRGYRDLAKRLANDDSLSAWRPLIHQCLAAYHRGHFAVVVPSLLAVVEGLLFSRASSLANTFRREELARPTVLAERALRKLDPGILRLTWVSIEAFVTALYARSDFRGAPPTLLNRHWTLHRAAQMPTRADCLRLMQAIDTITNVFEPPM